MLLDFSRTFRTLLAIKDDSTEKLLRILKKFQEDPCIGVSLAGHPIFNETKTALWIDLIFFDQEVQSMAEKWIQKIVSEEL
jgi:hypothetical protein